MYTNQRKRRWSNDPLWGTGYSFQKVYCDCTSCLKAASANSKKNRRKNK